MVQISVFGIGYVGAVSCGCLVSLGHDVTAVDISPQKIELLNQGVSPIVEAELDTLIADGIRNGRLRATDDVAQAVARSDISFVSVGTPSSRNGSVSMAAVDEVVRDIGTALRHKSGPHVVVMRSTVPPGTAEDRVIPALEQASGQRLGQGFKYYSNPEFLREGTAVRDFRFPPFTLLGAAPGDDAAALRSIYDPIAAPIHVADFRIIESVKYLSNAYHAVKLAFANEAGAVLAAYGVDAREAFRLFCQDRLLNISPAYLQPGFAFGGACLPKDVRSLLALADGRDVVAPFLRQVLPSNDAVISRALDAITSHGRQRVALFGLAFKPGTDDMRESPFVILAERLLGKGYDLRIFDRSVQVARLLGSNRNYIEREIPHLDRLLVPTVTAALEDSGMVVVGHLGGTDVTELVGSLDGQTVLDLAGVQELRQHRGIHYHGICW
jgi:GDP-mannose 6-dehydrogenase